MTLFVSFLIVGGSLAAVFVIIPPIVYVVGPLYSRWWHYWGFDL